MTAQPSILLVEDDKNLGFVIKDNLAEAGYEVRLCQDGEEGLHAFHNGRFSVCILDVMMPKKDGFVLAEDIRKADQQVPIIFLTAKSQDEDRIKGFKVGGDDYLTKPFNIEELVLRVEAILKRINRPQEDKDVFELGQFTFDHKNLELRLNGSSKSLTKKEADLLKLLCIHQNEVIEREMVLKIIWGEDDYFLGRSMDVFITKLRKYLKEDPKVQINNVHGVGFKLVVEG